MIGGTCLGVFCYVPRDLSNGTWIIAIGHHSRKLGRQVCLFFFPSVTLIFRILQKATGQSFRPIKLQIFNSKVQGPTGYPFWRLGGWDPLRGFVCPLKTPQRTKKVAVNHAKLCETYSPWSNKIFGDKMFDQGYP